MFLKDYNGTFWVFVCTKCSCLMKMDYWTEHTNNKWLFGHKLWNFMEQISHLLLTWDSWECLLMKIIKGKWIFMVLFLTLLIPKWWKCKMKDKHLVNIPIVSDLKNALQLKQNIWGQSQVTKTHTAIFQSKIEVTKSRNIDQMNH